jgi:hypothetical protein
MPVKDVQELDTLLPEYLGHRLGADERREVEEFLARHPQHQHLLLFHQAIRDSLRAEFDAIPDDVGWAKVQRKIAPRQGWAHGIDAWLKTFHRPVLAVSAAIVLGQAVTLGVLLSADAGPDLVRYRSESGVSVQSALRVSFNPGVSERDLRGALNRAGGRIVDGPSQFGDYTIVFGQTALGEGKRLLLESGIVASVAEIDVPAATR